MFRSKRWGIHLSSLRFSACKICTRNFEPFNHGLRTPYKAFFNRNHKLLDMGRHFGLINFGTVGKMAMFSIDHPLFLQKAKPLYVGIQIPNMCLGLEFEFGPQRIKDLAIVCS